MQGIKRNVLLILMMLFVGTFSAFAGNNQDSDAVDSSQSVYWENVMNAIIQVESGGNVNAKGDGGKAIGPLQIHKVVVDDVNRRYGTSYTYDDRKSLVKSKEICRKYLLMWGGKHATDERYARIWNGGPRWNRKVVTRENTRIYWGKVKSNLR